MTSLYVDLQVREGLHELRIEIADSVPALVMLAPSLIVIIRSVTECGEYTLKVMLVLQPNVLLDDR